MKLYQVEVRDTLVLRDNRPMATGAGRAPSMELPWPSTIAGLARTRLGSDANGVFTARDLDALRRVAVCGPWLVEDGSSRLFFPAPRDVVWFVDPSDESRRRAFRLAPGERRQGALYSDADLGVVRLENPPKTKAVSGPRFWSWQAYDRWLFGDGAAPDWPGDDVLQRLPEEERTHVSLKEDRTYEDGQLFTTTQRRFTLVEEGRVRSFSIGFGVAGETALPLGMAAFGGERRVAWVGASGVKLPAFDERAARFNGAKRLKVTLLTPAVLDDGALPSKKAFGGLPIVAASIPRPDVVSGWDFAAARTTARGRVHGAPKPTRRVVPAGAVYWLDAGEADATTVARSLWFQPVSTDSQDCRDGYGLAVVSVA